VTDLARYTIARLFQMAGVLLGVLTLVFFATRVLPSSPAELMLGARPTAEQVAVARAELGLDQPILIQFLEYAKNIFNGDFGTSLRTGQPVMQDIAHHLMATVELVSLSLLGAILLGLPLGVYSAANHQSAADNATRLFTLSGIAVPIFFLAILMQMVFYGWLGWLPLQGRIDSSIALNHPFETVTGFYLIDTLFAGNWPAFKSAFAHLVLPVMTVTLATVAIIARATRNLMVEVLASDHIRTVRAFGFASQVVNYRYGIRATLVPLMTIVGLTYGFMIGNSILTEQVFGWPGIGRYIVQAVIENDFPAVMATTLVLATSYLSINLLVDILYFVADPRLRVGGGK
jgi:peptide/nickel transport system permease protein